MVLSFGAMGDDIEDSLEGDDSGSGIVYSASSAGSDPLGIMSSTTPQTTVPLALVGPTTSVPTGSLSTSSPSSSSSVLSTGGSFWTNLGKSLLGTTANVAAQSINAANMTPAQLAAAQAAAAANAAAQQKQMLVIGGVVLGIIVIGGLLMRRGPASAAA